MEGGYAPVPWWALALPSQGPFPSKRGKTTREGTLVRTRVAATGVLLLGVLARYQGKNEAAWPAVDTLAKVLGLSRRAVLDQIEALEDAGAIAIERSAGRGSRYWIVAPVKDPSQVDGDDDDAFPRVRYDGSDTEAGSDGGAAGPSDDAEPVQDGAPVKNASRVQSASPVKDAAPDPCSLLHHTGEASFIGPVKHASPEEIREEINEDHGGGDLARATSSTTTTDLNLVRDETRDDRSRFLWSAWSDGFEKARGVRPFKKPSTAVDELVNAIAYQAGRDELDWERVALRVIDAYWATKWPRNPENRPTLENVLLQIDRLLETVHRSLRPPVAKARPPAPVSVPAEPSLVDVEHGAALIVASTRRGATA